MQMKTLFIFLALVSPFDSNALADVSKSPGMEDDQGLEQTLFYGGDIITMEGDKPTYVEAVLERNGEIIYVGTKLSALNDFRGKKTEFNLEGKTMMPGFIEPHLHPSIAAIMLPTDTIAPHEWKKPDGIARAA